MTNMRQQYPSVIGVTDLKVPSGLTTELLRRLRGLSPSIKTDYLLSQVLSKFVSSETASQEARAQAGLRKWLAAERDNEATEDRLLITSPRFQILPGVSLHQFREFCVSLVSSIIGETPPMEALIGSFGGGATTSRPRTQGHPALKYVGKADATLDCFSIFMDYCPDEMPIWFRAQIEKTFQVNFVLGNAMFTVPKKTDEDRVAAKEPDLNMFIQKGIGKHFRKCLRSAGINLNDQSINRSFAREGSITGQLATLDLSRASDSVTRELVFQFLPVCWFTLLDSVRSRETVLLGGDTHRNTMFSSMGNGFTFDLESLLFYVLCRATCYFTGTPGVVSVYGDDLIVPTEVTELVIWVLSFFGFQVNTEKSFWKGPFRESCGGHYHAGFDITPFYIKGEIQTLPDLIHVANQLREWSYRKPSVPDLVSYEVLDPEVEGIWLWLKSMIPECLWGGSDTSFKFQLVSYDTPHLRLSEKKKRWKTGIGGYLQWLNSTWDRNGVIENSVITSSSTKDVGKLVLKPVRDKAVPRLEGHFIHEVVGGPRKTGL